MMNRRQQIQQYQEKKRAESEEFQFLYHTGGYVPELNSQSIEIGRTPPPLPIVWRRKTFRIKKVRIVCVKCNKKKIKNQIIGGNEVSSVCYYCMGRDV